MENLGNCHLISLFIKCALVECKLYYYTMMHKWYILPCTWR